jgi:tetratricopeptide (TPR) repeat protein
VQDLLGEFSDKKHYYLNVDKPDGSLKFLEHIEIKTHSEIETIIDELLKLKEEAENEKFADKRRAEEYKKQKEEAEIQIKTLNQELAIKEDQIKRFELFSWEYFDKGLDYPYNEKYKEAAEQFKIATEFNSDNDSAFYNWGLALSYLAQKNDDASLYKESFDKYDKATSINSDNDSAFYNWGLMLHYLAQKNDDESLYRESCEKYDKATSINPDKDSAFSNWGNALMYLFAKTKEKDILNKAIEVCKKAYTINTSKSYNLSCCYVILNDKKNALKYLEESIVNKRIAIEHILRDEDWKNYLEDEDFKKLIEKYK